ncbi:polyhomeotic-like protein 3 isoform X4 [Rhinichthys klamathensis goyatoka]|uniref:polyhomeotic-like protein 3 isoform X4 n=1 Tax=Rhinichthys klamathensis goyatoka TaxID=3034132 RepID=UPI0024B57A99|nr:polyhomeotic-like protein 3 isoform X4 [Rhinichthys klamathensis goyatoka]
MGDTDKSSQEEMEGDSCVTVASSSAAPVSSTPRSNTPTGTQPNSIPLGNISSDRQAVQVFQQTLHRPQSMTAQYLQQMYAAQQQHILLQTAALQQQHQQILTTTEQAAQTNGRQPNSSPTSSNGNVTQLASVSQTSITMPTSLVTQPIGRIQVTSSNSTGGAISQQAMLLGNSSPTGSQAQMYLRTQMLILTPAATVAAVQPDLTVVSSMSSHSASSQVQSLALRTHLPGALATPQNFQIKSSLQGQTLVCPPPKMSIFPLKSTQLSQNLVEASRSESILTDVTQPPSAQPHIPPSTFTPVQSHTLVRHQLHCPSSQRLTPHQLIIQQSSSAHRQVQPIALRVTPQNSSPPPLALQTRTTPTTATVQSQHTDFLSVPSSVNQPANQSAVVSTVPPAALPDPPPLHLGPVLEPVSQHSPLACPPPLTMGLPRPVQPQRLSLRSVQTVAVQSDHMVSEEEHPAAEAVVQLPFHNLPPPQTVAVDLKLQPATQTGAPSAMPLLKESGSMNLLKDVEHDCPQYIRASTPPPLSPPDESQRSSDDVTAQPENCTADPDQPCIPSSRSVIRSPEDPTYANSSPPPLLSSAVRRASLEMNLQATLPEDREDEQSARDDCLMDADNPENSTDSDIDNTPAEDEQTVENLPDVLECEFCGKRGFARTFLRSKRFCSITCVRRFNVSCKKRLNLLRPEKVVRWLHRPMGRRGRPPSRVHAGSREHYLKQQLQDSHRSNDNQRVSNSMWIEREEEDSPGPMTTRLRLQAEREKQQDREREQSRLESCSSSDCVLDSSPSQWSVEQVCSFISSLPGCHDIAAEFRSQEIDGQALLLLTEDHLMSAMNMKLGPALKICAQINALKEP